MKRLTLPFLLSIALLWPPAIAKWLFPDMDNGTLAMLALSNLFLWPVHIMAVLVVCSAEDHLQSLTPLDTDADAQPRQRLT